LNRTTKKEEANIKMDFESIERWKNDFQNERIEIQNKTKELKRETEQRRK
jgi:hypothetical protein